MLEPYSISHSSSPTQCRVLMPFPLVAEVRSAAPLSAQPNAKGRLWVMSRIHTKSPVNRWFRIVNASNHAVGTVHEKRYGAMVDFDPFHCVHVLQKTSKVRNTQRWPSSSTSSMTIGVRSTNTMVHGTVFSHFKECSVNVEVNFQVRFKFLQQRRNVLSSHWPSLADAPFVGHALR